MPKTEYVSKALNLLSDYLKVPTNPTPDLENRTRDITTKALRGKIPGRSPDKLVPRWTRTAEFYGLPKTHKPGNPLRPIVSACGDPFDKLSWFLQQVLTQTMQFVPTHLENTGHYLDKLKGAFPGSLPDGAIAFSLDVVNLYGSITIKEAITATINLIKRNIDKINVYGLSFAEIETLLTHILTNFIRFGTSFYKQTDGIAMGNRLAPPIAIAFMHNLDSNFVNIRSLKPSILLRYIDERVRLFRPCIFLSVHVYVLPLYILSSLKLSLHRYCSPPHWFYSLYHRSSYIGAIFYFKNAPPPGFSRIAKKRRRAAPPGFHPPYPPSFRQPL